MEKPGNPPATIRLQADELEISLQRIASALYDSLRAENKKIFSLFPGAPSQSTNIYHWGDFRSGIMAGPLNTSLLDDGEQVKIKQTRKIELEKQLLFYSKFIPHLTGEELAQADRNLSDMQLRVDSILAEPLSNIPMGQINRIRVQGRIRKRLDDDVASERLMVSSIGGKDVVLLDHLVTWAILRKITVVQEAFPGCTSFVHASYQRVHQHLKNVTQNLTSARSGGVEPDAGPLAAFQPHDMTPSPAPMEPESTADGLEPDAGQLAAFQPQETRPSSAPVGAVCAPRIIHSTKTRRDTLTPVIELAQKQCQNPQDTAEVWAVLLVLAEKKSSPLIGTTEDGLQYLNKGTADIFKKKSLGQRLAR